MIKIEDVNRIIVDDDGFWEISERVDEDRFAVRYQFFVDEEYNGLSICSVCGEMVENEESHRTCEPKYYTNRELLETVLNDFNKMKLSIMIDDSPWYKKG